MGANFDLKAEFHVTISRPQSAELLQYWKDDKQSISQYSMNRCHTIKQTSMNVRHPLGPRIMHVPQLQHNHGAWTHTATSFSICYANTRASERELLTLYLGQSGRNMCQPWLNVFCGGQPSRAQSLTCHLSPVTCHLSGPRTATNRALDHLRTLPVPISSNRNLLEGRPVRGRQPVGRMNQDGSSGGWREETPPQADRAPRPGPITVRGQLRSLGRKPRLIGWGWNL